MMLNEECQARLNEIIEDSSDGGFEFEPPEGIWDAKNKIAKMLMFYLNDIGGEFDLGRWNEAQQKRLTRAASYFFKMLDNFTLSKETTWESVKNVPKTGENSRHINPKQNNVGMVLEFEVDYEVNKNALTLNDYLEGKFC
jgi:hypothetical protein